MTRQRLPHVRRPPLNEHDILQSWNISIGTTRRVIKIACRTSTPVATIPQIRPALVMSLPDGSIRPVAISCKSLLPITHAATPKNGHMTKPRIPNTRMRTARCDFIRSGSTGERFAASIAEPGRRILLRRAARGASQTYAHVGAADGTEGRARTRRRSASAATSR